MPPTPAERLSSVRAKIERAKQHIKDLDAACRAFKDSGPYGVSFKLDADRRERRYRVDFVRDVPTDISLIAGDAISNLRSALDHLALQLFLVGPAGGDRLLDRKIYFPIAESAAKLEARLEGPPKVFGQEAVKAIRALEPYKGGEGHELWVLSELNNLDKHRLLITAALGFLKGVYLPEFRMSGPEFSSRGLGKKCPLKQGDELYAIRDAEVYQEPQFGIEVAFAESEVVQGKPVLESLHHLANLVESTAAKFAQFL